MYAYSHVEEALAKVNGCISEGRFPAFRSRLQYYRRLGIVQETPGRGKRVKYTINHIWIWAFGLSLAQLGIDPMAIKKLIEGFKPVIISAFEAAGRSSDRVYIVFNPFFVTIPVDAVALHHADFFQTVTLDQMKDRPDYWIGGGACILNISDLRERLADALQSSGSRM